MKPTTTTIGAGTSRVAALAIGLLAWSCTNEQNTHNETADAVGRADVELRDADAREAGGGDVLQDIDSHDAGDGAGEADVLQDTDGLDSGELADDVHTPDAADVDMDANAPDADGDVPDSHDAEETAESTLETYGFRLMENTPGLIEDRFVPVDSPNRWEDEGSGGVLFNYDDDGLPDLFLGGHVDPGSPACVLRNTSEPGSISFAPVDSLCPGPLALTHSGTAVDINDDGYDELLIGGKLDARLVQFYPEYNEWDLLAAMDEVGMPYECVRGVIVTHAFDLDLDGWDDMLFACRLNGWQRDGLIYTFLWDPQAQQPVPVDIGLSLVGYTMSAASTDLNDDGLPDLLIQQGSVLLGAWTQYGWHPGGVFYRLPGPTPRWNFERFEEDANAWGAFMSPAIFHGPSGLARMMITDWGQIRLYENLHFPSVNVAAQHGLGLDAVRDGIATWSILVDDFNRDGLEDLFITEGTMVNRTDEEFLAHRDNLIVQEPSGEFSIHGQEAGLRLHTPPMEEMLYPAWASRSAIRADIDRDGRLDIVRFALEGHPIIYTEVGPAVDEEPRCTVIPEPRYLQAGGYGYTIENERYAAPLRWNMQGHVRAGQSHEWAVPFRSGVLNFPSGYSTPFDCGADNVVEIEEPEWLSYSWAGDSLTVTVDTTALGNAPDSIQVFGWDSNNADVGSVTCDTHECSLSAPDLNAVQAKLDDRWIPLVVRRETEAP